MTQDAQSVTQELKPCPFCGATDLIRTVPPREFGCRNSWGVTCARCMGAPIAFDSKAEAITAWNTRASQPTSAEDAVADTDYVARLEQRIEQERGDGLTGFALTTGTDPKDAQEVARVALAMLDYTRPTPDTQTAATSAEAMREALESVQSQCQFTISQYERNGPAYTSQATGEEYEPAWFVQAKLRELLATIESTLSQPVAAPQAEMADDVNWKAEWEAASSANIRYRKALDQICDLGCCGGKGSFQKALDIAVSAVSSTPPQPEGCTVAREVQAVWRCAVGDFVGAVDVLKNRWINSRRKHEREAGEELNRLASLIWAARSPAPESYDDARKAGTALIERVRATLQPEKTKP